MSILLLSAASLMTVFIMQHTINMSRYTINTLRHSFATRPARLHTLSHLNNTAQARPMTTSATTGSKDLAYFIAPTMNLMKKTSCGAELTAPSCVPVCHNNCTPVCLPIHIRYLFPLNGAGGLGCDVVYHAVDGAHLVTDASGHFAQERGGECVPVGSHAVTAGDCA